MQHGARWWVDRLRAMSLAEVSHRGLRLARYPIDLAQARYGRVPEALRARWRGPAIFVFSQATARAPISDALRAAADAALAGRHTVLGLGARALPDEPWHLEPSAGGAWPVVAAARVVAAAPAGFDARTTWELNRGAGWVVLARAYAATGEPRYRDRLVRELRSWQRRNPIGVGINWVSAMEAAIRCHAFAWIAALLRGDPDAPVWRLLAELLYQHAAFVARNLSRFSSANNHLIVELSALAVAGRVLGVPRWHARGLAELDREAARQTWADGVNVEMATHYHMFVLEALLLVAWLERAHGAPARGLEAVIARMAAYLAAITLPSGAVLHQGDNDDGVLVPLLADRHADQLLAAAHALVAAPTAAAAPPRKADRAGVGHAPPALDGAYLLCDGALAPPPPPLAPRSQRFADAGQVVLRGPRLHATFDAGPFGFGALAAHAHCDALAVTLAFDGAPLIVERGTYRYNGDRAARDRYRGTAAHNTVQVGAREQGQIAGPFLWSRKPVVSLDRCLLEPTGDVVRASHDGFAPARHVRTLVRAGDALTILDEVHAAVEPCTARWHLAPGCLVRHDKDGWLTVHDPAGRDRRLWLGCDGQPLPARVITTRHSPRYLAEQDAPTLELTWPGGRLVTIIAADAAAGEAALRRAGSLP